MVEMKRIALWVRDQWVELKVEHVHEVERPTGKTLAVFASLEYATGGTVDSEPFLRALDDVPVPSELDERVRVTLEPDAEGTIVVAGEDGQPLNEVPPPPPTWGGRDPKDVPDEVPTDDDVVQVRYFTLTFEDGSEAVDQTTSKGSTVAEAEAAIRRTWSAMGKAVSEAKHQPGGRLGEDRPRAGKAKPTDPEPVVQPYDVGDAPPDADEGRATLFRWHRGSLDESMATATPCHTLAKLIEILRTGPGLEDVAAERVDVTHYTYDERIDWDTYLVTVDGNAVGMTNGEL